MTQQAEVDEDREMLKTLVFNYSMPPYSFSQSRIAKQLKISRGTIYKLQKELVADGKITKDEKGNVLVPTNFKTPYHYHEVTESDFGEDPLIMQWLQSMKRSGKVRPNSQVNILYVFCETIKIRPVALLGNILDVQSLVDTFENKFRAGQAKYIRPSLANIQDGKQDTAITTYVKAVKSFIERNGKEIPRGFLEVKQQTFDIYKRIKLDDLERKRAIEFMGQFGEIMQNAFILHHEFGVRPSTLFEMEPTFEKKTVEIDGVLCEYYVCYIYEKKQKKTYEKIVFTPEGRMVVNRIKPGERLSSKEANWRTKQEYNEKLRLLYQFLGKYDPAQRPFKQGTLEYFFDTEATGVLRHSCVHKLMRMTGHRSDIVASMFWERPQTLDIYASTSINAILQQGVCFVCNKPKTLDYANEVFCSLRHAILYYQQEAIPSKQVDIPNPNTQIIPVNLTGYE